MDRPRASPIFCSAFSMKLSSTKHNANSLAASVLVNGGLGNGGACPPLLLGPLPGPKDDPPEEEDDGLCLPRYGACAADEPERDRVSVGEVVVDDSGEKGLRSGGREGRPVPVYEGERA